MDAWHCIAERNDAIRRWAELEGKSAQMTEELYRRRVASIDRRVYWPVTVALLLRLAALVAEIWWRTCW